MNDNQHNISLYSKLLDVVGTEEEIKLRQDIFRCMDLVNGFGDRDSVSISGGSLAEGLNLKGSDEDIIIVLKNVDVVPDEEIHERTGGYIKVNMNMDKMRPGYACLCLNKNEATRIQDDSGREAPEFTPILKALETSEDKCIIYSSKFRAQFTSPGRESHGPCISDGLYDFAISLKGSAWPRLAQQRLESIYKSSPNWISEDLAKKILADGCIYVPVGPKNIDPEILWRVSFATAEKRLVRSMNHIHMLCYGLLKIVLKEGITNYLPSKDLLCSYFLKTCMFWTIEETNNSAEVWSSSGIYSCYQRCMDKLINFTETCNCPNYFFPKNNMFLYRINEENKDSVINTLRKYRDGGYDVISNCETLGNYMTCVEHVSEDDREAMLDIFCFRSLHIYPFDDKETLLLGLNALELKYERQHHQYTRGVLSALISSLHQELPQMIKLSENNEENKHLLKLQKDHLLQGCRTDRLCGLILLASYHCTNRSYYSALEILNTVICKLVPGSGILIRRSPDYSTAECQAYKENYCGKKYTLQQKFEMGTVRNIILLDNSSIVPEAFQPELFQYRPLTLIPPAVYAHALRCICYIRLGNSTETEKTLRTLDEIVEKNFLISQKERLFSTACTIVGACYEENGNHQRAKQYYERALNEIQVCQSVKDRKCKLEQKMNELQENLNI